MIVVDASVVYKWIVDEQGQETLEARKLRDRFLMGTEEVTAPDILLYEIANILAYKTSLSPRDMNKAWKSYVLLHISTIGPLVPFMGQCLEFSQKYHVSVYDASYIVLAKERRGVMVTADRKLVDRVKLPYVKYIMAYQHTNLR